LEVLYPTFTRHLIWGSDISIDGYRYVAVL